MSGISKDDELGIKIAVDPTPDTQLLTKMERKRNISFLTISSLFASSANSIHFIFYSLYFLEINDSEKLFGIIGTVSSFIAILGLILADYLNGLLGYKRVLIIAQILIAIAFSFFIFNPSKIYWIVIAILILSLAFSLSESPSNIILTETAGDKKKGTITSLIAFFGRLGEVIVSGLIFLITVFLGKTYTNADRAWYYLYATIAVALITIGIIFLITDPSKKMREKIAKEKELRIQENKEEEESEEVKEGKEEIALELSKEKRRSKGSEFVRGFVETFKDKWVLRVAITFFMDAFLWSIAFGVHWAGLQDEDLFGVYAIDDKEISLLIMITGITILTLMFLGRFVDKIGAKFFLFISEICGLIWIILSVIYTYYPQYIWLMRIARISLGASIALWIPATIALFTNVSPERKSKVYNSIAIFRSIGWLPGGFIAGYLYDGIPQPYGFLTPMFILIGGMCILIPLFYTLPNTPKDLADRRNKNKNK